MLNKELFTELFEKYTSGTITRDERESFFQLIRQYPSDPLMGLLMDDLYEKIKTEELEKRQSEQEVATFRGTGKVRKLFYKVAAAAVFAGVIIMAGFYFLNNKTDYKSKLAGNIYQTEKAEQNFILLPDSTQIWINASTDVRFPKAFAKDKREIYLEGEAFLDVKHADKKPFIIHLPGNISVTVLGTAFNIKAFPDREQAIVTVKRGKVKVSRGEKELSVLTAGQEIRVSITSNNIAYKQVVAEQVNSWQTGNLYFNDIMLKDVVKDIAQQKNADIRIESEKLGNTIINTGFKKDETLSDIMAILKAITDCNVREENGAYILY